MNSRSLRGTRLGSLSMETDEGVLAAPRQESVYDCPNGHTIVLPFSVEADVPAVWECRCGASALLRDHERPELKPGKPIRTHWDMLLERRSEEDLQVLLDQRLALLRAGKLHQRRNLWRRCTDSAPVPAVMAERGRCALSGAGSQPCEMVGGVLSSPLRGGFCAFRMISPSMTPSPERR